MALDDDSTQLLELLKLKSRGGVMGREEEKVVVDCLWWCGILRLGRRTRSKHG
jgi:hypothetical protein